MRSALIENGVVVNVIKGQVAGSVECPAEVSKGWTYDGHTFTAPPAPPEPEPTSEDVNDERDRRVRNGRVFTTTSGKQVHVTGRPIDKENLQGLAFNAQLLIGQDMGETITRFRDGQNIIHDLTQHELLDLWQQASAFVSLCFQAAWVLKDDYETIPADYAENEDYWP